MKKYQRIFTLIFVCTLIVTLFSCGDDDDSTPIPSELYGTWYGVTGSREVYLTLKSDGTGEFQYSSKAYFRVAEFTYKYEGNTIICDGYIVGEDGAVNKFDQQFRYDAPYVYPIGAYSDHVLKKDFGWYFIRW